MMRSKKIVITRAIHQADELANLLRGHGAEPLLFPCLEIAPIKDTTKLDLAIRRVAQGFFDWTIFTSSNTVSAIASRIQALSISMTGLNNSKIAAIGPSTKSAVQEHLKAEVDLIPNIHVAEALAEALMPVSGKRIFLPQSQLARPALNDRLKTGGADVHAVTAYQTRMAQGGIDLSAALDKNEIDAITFTSSSSVSYFIKRSKLMGNGIQKLKSVCIACLGSVTAQTARQAGLSVSVLSSGHTIEDLVSELGKYFKEQTLEV